MKKQLFTFLSILVLISGCQKDLRVDNSIISLKNELNRVANSYPDKNVSLDPCNTSNPFDAYGEALFMAFAKVVKIKSELEKTSLTLNREQFKNKVLSEIPKEYLTLDTTGVNLGNVKPLLDEFLHLFTHRSVFESVYLCKEMESIVLQSGSLNEVDKVYLLKFVSLLRHFRYLNYTSSKYGTHKKGLSRTYEECWIAGLQAIEDSGFFQSLACICSWPVCLSALAADCAWEQLME